MIVLVSVWHTGTNFVFQHLFAGLAPVGMNHNCYLNGHPPNSGLVRIHCDFDQHKYLPYWVSKFRCVVPLRHPLSVARSWKAREKNLKLLPVQWQVLKRDVAPHNPLYLPLDALDRQDWLDRINEALGMDLQTDWPVIMSCEKTATLTEAERDSVSEVMADGFFDRFGYEV